MRARDLTYRFDAGEWSGRMADRVDRELYAAALEVMLNVMPTVEGPATRAPGTELVARVRDDGPGRLVTFRKSNDDQVMVEITQGNYRFYDAVTLARLEKDGVPIDVDNGISGTVLPDLYMWQSADVMWVVSRQGNRQPATLKRFADDNWVQGEFYCDNGPWLPENIGGVSLDPSSVTGEAITVNALGGGPFVEGMVGGLLRILHAPGGVPYKTWEPEKDYTQNQVVYYAGRVYQAGAAATSSNTPPTHSEGDVGDGGAQFWRYLHDLQGVIEITGYASASQVTGAVRSRLPSAASTPFWAEGCFSASNGWPRIGGIFEQRLFFCSTDRQPDTLFFSQTAGYRPERADFKPDTGGGDVVDTNGIQLTLADGEVNAPHWALVDDVLYLGTSKGILRISGPSDYEALTPAAAISRTIKGAPGSYSGFRAIKTDSTIVYVSVGGKRLFHLDADRKPRELTRDCRHVGAQRIVEGVWLSEPYNRLFIRREDNTLWCFAYQVDEERPDGEVIAACRLDVGGTVESIEKASDDEGNDRLWMIVARRVDGQTVRTIERLAMDWEGERHRPDEAVYVDGAVTVDRWNLTTKTVTVSWADEEAGAVTVDCSSSSMPGLAVGTTLRVRKGAPPGVGAPDVTVDIALTGKPSATRYTGQILSILPDDLAGTALTGWAVPAPQIAGLGHLEGRAVMVQADGMEFGPYMVSGGSVTVDVDFARAVAGLAKPWEAVGHAIVVRADRGLSLGAEVKPLKAWLSYRDTAPGQVVVEARQRFPAGDRVDSHVIGTRGATDLLGLPLPPRTGGEEVEFSCDFARETRIAMRGAGVLPVTIKSLSLEYETNG